MLIERYYHHLFTSDEEIHALCREIGIPDELKAWPSSMAMFSHGKLYPFTSPLDLLRYKPLSLWRASAWASPWRACSSARTTSAPWRG